ncbi:major capsid protein [Dipodfec virus UA06Rod_12]|uniref:Major capsid protein n=1 Tax=Dipodfec virus UA06Rod_12 TaxID=2929316 RepID=A0A976N1C7_9VIRU|nr:major capsid protein [Dipodfec virus UA06Rod_12]
MQYNIAPSASNRTNTSLSHHHLTTIDFNQILPVQATDCIIGDEHHVEISPFIRLAPLAVPTYGDFRLRLVTFFVPYYQVFPHFDDFYSGITNKSGKYVGELYNLNLTDLFQALGNNTDAQRINNVAKEDFNKYDYVIRWSEDNSTDIFKNIAFRLGTRSKAIFKILTIFGYVPNSLSNLHSKQQESLNALPILCFLKAFNDWLSLSSFYNNSELSKFLANPLKANYNFTIDCDKLISILDLYIHPLIGSDYFTSAYNYAVSSNGVSVDSSLSKGFLESLDTKQQHAVSATNNSVDLHPKSDNSLSAFGLRFLQSYDRFVRRNQLSGTRAAQRIYAAFGLKSEDFRSNYAHIVNQVSIPFNVGDVTATAANADPALGLGTYAGQSVASGKYSFDYKCDDFGLLFTVAFVEVKSQYKAAYTPMVLRKSNLDFYQPDFDGVGFQPVSQAQLFCNLKYDPEFGYQDINTNKIFGFVPRYEDYRTEVDKVSGDFMLFDSMNSWHFGREFFGNNALQTAPPQSNQFQFTGSEFDRIFTKDINDNQTIYDHFFCSFNIQHNAVRPIKSRAGSVDFQDGHIQIESLGKTVSSM